MFFAMLIMFFIFMRLASGRCHRFPQLHHYHHHNHRQRPVRLQPAPPKPTPFERLKQRYVDGDLSDEQYEEELDKLLRVGRAAQFDTSARSNAGA